MRNKVVCAIRLSGGRSLCHKHLFIVHISEELAMVKGQQYLDVESAAMRRDDSSTSLGSSVYDARGLRNGADRPWDVSSFPPFHIYGMFQSAWLWAKIPFQGCFLPLFCFLLLAGVIE